MTIVFASHSPFDKCLVVGAHHLARALAEEGHQVWHIGPPVTTMHLAFLWNSRYRGRLRRAFGPPREMQPNLLSMEPFTLIPWQVAKAFLSHGNLFVGCSNIGSSFVCNGIPGGVDVLVIDDPRFLGLERLLQPRRVIYRATDFYSEMKADPCLIAAERQLLKNCSGMIATSQPVLAHVQSLREGIPSLLLENGVDWNHFAKPAEEPAEIRCLPHPRLIYVGAVDFRFDLELLDFMALNLPRVQFVIVGPGKLQALRRLKRTNIHVLGSRPYLEIPGFLHHSDIGLLPFVDNLANAGRSPIKLYEYGAAGLPVLASWTQELERRREFFLHLFQTREEAVEGVQRILRTRPDRQAIAESCQAHAWTNRSAALLNFVQRTSQLSGNAGHHAAEELSFKLPRKLRLFRTRIPSLG